MKAVCAVDWFPVTVGRDLRGPMLDSFIVGTCVAMLPPPPPQEEDLVQQRSSTAVQ